MAATDLVYNTVDPVLFTPDYSFLRYTLDKSQARYDQGLDAVSKSYNKLKASLTDPVNKERRDQFLKDAQGQLQKIASSDLSLAANINAANNVFDPLATNSAFIYDSYHTDRINRQLSIMDDWANSTDMETRKQYSPEIQQWVARELNVLKNGKGDINNYKGMENRSAFAYVDAQDILLKAAKDQGFKFKTDSIGQPYIVTTEGGTAGVPSYKAFAETVLGGDQLYQRQLKILSQNDKESLVEAYKKNPAYAGKSDAEIYYDGGLSSYDRHRTSTKTYLDDLNNNYKKEEAGISAYINANKDALEKGRADLGSGNNGTPEAQMFTKLMQRHDAKNSLKATIADQQANFNETFGDGSASDKFRQAYAEKFSKDPQMFYADQRYKNDIQRFSDIRASSLETKITPDSAYVGLTNSRNTALKDLANIQNQLTDNAMDEAKLNEKIREFDIKTGLKGKTTTITNPDGTTTTVKGKSEISAQSASSYVLYTVNAINKLKDKIEFARSKANTNMTSTSGALSLLNSFGLDNKSTGLIKTAFSRQLDAKDPSKSVGLNKEEQEALRTAFYKMQALAGNAGIKIEDGELSQLTMRTLPQFMKKAVAGFTMQNESDKKAKYALSEYFRNDTEMNQAVADYNKGKQAVIAKYGDPVQHPEYTGMFISRGKDANGKEIYDMIGSEDVEKQINIAFKGNSNITEDQKKKIVNSYLDGTLKYDIDAHVWGSTGGAAVPAQGPSFTETLTLGDGTKIDRYVPSGGSNMFGKIPFPDKYKQYTKIFNEIPVPDWTNQQGMMLANPRYVVSGEIAEDIRKDMVYGSQTNSNIWEYGSGTAEPNQVKVELQPEIRKAMADKDNVAEISIFTGTSMNQGGTSVAVTFKNKHADGSKGKQDWEGQQYFFPISINQTTPAILQRFAQVDDVGDFAYYRQKGDDYVMDAFEADGIKAIIHPNKAGDQTGYIEILYKPWIEATKSYGDWTPMDPLNGYPEYDESLMTINEIKNLIYEKKLSPYVSEVLSRKATTKQTTNSLPTLESLSK
jgi:hypothetical protein